ncbi:hypothetical protein Hanom_Chr16g01502361 [Helianthus anomalus]
MFTSNCRPCPLAQKLTSFVHYISKSCTTCPLGQTQLDFLVKFDHVPCTCGYFCHFIIQEILCKTIYIRRTIVSYLKAYMKLKSAHSLSKLNWILHIFSLF